MSVFLDFIRSDWYFAFPMFGMSLTAIALVVWRIMLNRSASSDLSSLLPALQEKLSKEGVDGATRFCKGQPGLIPKRILAGGLETSKQGMAAMRRAMANSMELEVLPDLNFLLPTILAIAKIATMVGLLGTVISMIGTFSEIQELTSKGQAITSKSGAIGLALFATALGLVTAIPLVFAHVLFKAWIGNFEIKAKSAAGKLMLLVQAQKIAPAPAKTAPPAETAVTRR
ncbi:MAG: MotA/TolQ/ExbB proton channel family protein [Gemmataceae bacterium]